MLEYLSLMELFSLPQLVWQGLEQFPDLLADPNSRDFALEVVKTLISALSLLATGFAALGLFFNYWDAQRNRLLAEERLVTDRFAKAVEQLGNREETVRIGGIYALERIAKDYPKDQWTIVEVLSSYIRRPPFLKELKEETTGELTTRIKVRNDVQAALTVIGRRNPKNDLRSDEKNFWNATVNLGTANLTQAYLWQAELGKAYLRGSCLQDSYFWETNLQNADLRETKLEGADFLKTNLRGANFVNAKNLTPVQIKSACNWQEAIYKEDRNANRQFIEELKKDSTSDPDLPIDCSQWKSKSKS